MFSRLNNDNKVLILIIISSLAIKLAVCGYGIVNMPSYKFMPDTPTYIEPGINLIEKGVFATFTNDGRINYEIIRTPGYPVFLALLNKTLKCSFDGIIIVQILLITFAGYIVYRAAYELDRKIALLAASIFLFDLPVTMTSLLLLSESLYTVFIAVFMYLFLRYLKTRNIYVLISSAILLAIATYIRPISYYLGFCISAGLLFSLPASGFRKALAHCLIFFVVFYGLTGIWSYRNYVRTGTAEFSTIGKIDLQNMGLTHKYAREIRSKDIKTAPLLYYAGQATECINIFFTRPGTLKYLRSEPIKVLSKIFGYPWVVFWIAGLFFVRYNKVTHLFLLFTILYFMAVSVVGVGLCVGSRFRAPVMPLISILSASGWIIIYPKIREILSRWVKVKKPV
ncbi:MAG: glycosyltransferase family 39 protein [Candidatus Omnitrophica bacterium]|nr:glycosyltransferase family 39 protein [Candidatus Omnitrophota bacterium]